MRAVGSAMMLPVVQRRLLVAAVVGIGMARNVAADLAVELGDLGVAIDELLARTAGQHADHMTDPGNHAIAERVVEIHFGKRLGALLGVITGSRRRRQVLHQIISQAESRTPRHRTLAAHPESAVHRLQVLCSLGHIALLLSPPGSPRAGRRLQWSRPVPGPVSGSFSEAGLLPPRDGRSALGHTAPTEDRVVTRAGNDTQNVYSEFRKNRQITISGTARDGRVR